MTRNGTTVDTRELHTAADEGEAWWFAGTRTVVRNPAGSQELPVVLEMTIPAGGSPPLHIHDTLDDSFLLLAGELVVRCGERRFVAKTGDYVSLPSGVPHTFRVTSFTPARLLTIHSDGTFLGLVKAVGERADTPGLPTSEIAVDLDRMAAANAEHGSRIIGPSMTEEEAQAVRAADAPDLAAPSFSQVDHDALTVSDLAASEAWYSDVFGLIRVDGAIDEDGNGHLALLDANTGIVIALASARAADPAGVEHLAFRVSDRAALADWRDSLRARGFETGTITDAPYGSGFVVRDPDGVQLELFAPNNATEESLR